MNDKGFVKNIDKGIFWFMCGALILTLFATAVTVPMKYQKIKQENESRMITYNDELKGIDLDAQKAIADLKKYRNADEVADSLKRDPFVKFVKPDSATDAQAESSATQQQAEPETASVELLSVKYIPMPIIYKGFISMPDGTVTAQINFKNATRFAKINDDINGWRVVSINKKYLIMMDRSKREVIFEYNRETPSEELSATLKDLRNGSAVVVKKGQQLNEFFVTDITEDSVTLSAFGSTFNLRLNK